MQPFSRKAEQQQQQQQGGAGRALLEVVYEERLLIANPLAIAYFPSCQQTLVVYSSPSTLYTCSARGYSNRSKS